MPAVIASLVQGKTDWGAGAHWLKRTVTGWQAHQDWRIDNTLDVSLAAKAPELPTMRTTPFSADVPGLTPVAMEFTRIGGTYDTAAQAGGFVWCSVDYETPQFGGRLPDPRPGDKYSEFKAGLDKLHRVYDGRIELGTVDFEYVPPTDATFFGQVKGGKGFDAFIGETLIAITVFMADENVTEALFRQMIRLAKYQMVNKLSVTIPPIYGTSVSFTAGPGELRYVGYEHAAERGIVKLVHTVAAGPDWFLRWTAEDETGKATGNPHTTLVYPAGNFNGLWT